MASCSKCANAKRLPKGDATDSTGTTFLAYRCGHHKDVVHEYFTECVFYAPKISLEVAK